jgi:hypothetical protein
MSGILKIVDKVSNLLNGSRVPVIPIPAVLLLCSVFKRPGASCMLAAANVIKRQSEFGAPTGALPDGSSNMMNALVYVNMCETMRELRENSIVEVVIPPNTVVINSSGANAGGPVLSVGTNTTPIKGYGIIR